MRFSSILLILATVCSPWLASGETLREIELTDGSIIQAEVVSMSQGVYRLRSNALGEIEIPEHRIRTIRSPQTETTTPRMDIEKESLTPAEVPSTPAPASSAEDLQQMFQQDPAAMEKILSLQNDPLVQSILDDAGTMQAIEAGDIGILLNDPKIRALMSHPTVQELSGKLGQ
ncbi:MAG TPA: hypothetical protein VGX03_20460 [Candidatus Binatia bacterium]|jgi:hypothetical protein|nr:hypothetical protein [Candidatus Binatia bacterium]